MAKAETKIRETVSKVTLELSKDEADLIYAMLGRTHSGCNATHGLAWNVWNALYNAGIRERRQYSFDGVYGMIEVKPTGKVSK